jgi:hypothetical protein
VNQIVLSLSARGLPTGSMAATIRKLNGLTRSPTGCRDHLASHVTAIGCWPRRWHMATPHRHDACAQSPARPYGL